MSDKNIFQGLDDVFNTKYELENELAEQQNEKEAGKKKRKLPSLSNDKRDKAFVKEELVTLVDKANKMMELLEEELKIGANPRFHETYAAMMSTQMSALDRLRNLEVTDREYDMRLKRLELETDKQNFDKDYKMRLLEAKANQPQVNFNQQIIASSGSNDGGTTSTQQISVTTSDDVFALIERAKKESQNSSINAEFTTESN
jgi:hypothetical protein